MSEPAPVSPYAPPRAGHAAWFWRFWFGSLRACPTLGRLPTSSLTGIRVVGMLILVVFVPLLGIHIAGRPLRRHLAAPLFLLAAVFALACVAQAGGGVALGIMAAIHAVGIAEYLNVHFPSDSPVRRVMRQSGLVLGGAVLVIWFGPSVTGLIVVPIGTADGIALVNPLDRTPPFAPQTAVALRMSEYYQAGFRVGAGVYSARVIAGPGSKVVFAPGVVIVNGVRRDALLFMPGQGEINIPPGRTLVWPIDLQRRGRAPNQDGLMPSHFVVPDSALVGRLYKRWFWRTFTP